VRKIAMFLVMKICKCMRGNVLTPKQIEEVLCMVRSSIPHVNPAVIAMIFILVRHAFLVV
jgi:hypothetical protein